jgi:MFS family permease
MGTPVFRNRWWVVFASAVGLIAGSGTIIVFAAGIFIKPVALELGFGRGTISTGLGLASILLGVLAPFLGRMFDRYGVRRVMLPLTVLFALAT